MAAETTAALSAPPPAPHVLTHLRAVPFLRDVDDETLAEVATAARLQTFARGATLVSELESGADVFVLTKGEATISVDATGGQRQIVGRLSAGGAFGEMSSLTGELRSATVTADSEVEVLVIPDATFDRLRARRPQIAVALVRLLADRLADTDQAIDALLRGEEPDAKSRASVALTRAAGVGKDKQRGSLSRVWRELVVAKKRDLGFLTLTAFALTLIVVRLAVYLSFRFDVAPKDVLRAAYMTGFTSLVASACASLLTFRPGFRRVIAVLYGLGLALIFNELGVTLAFDIFFKDIHTADPSVPFDVERLYRRAEPLRAIGIGFVVLVQLAYLRRFYARAAFVIRTRLRGLLFRKR